MGATRVYSTAAYYVAAAVAILLGLCPKFGAIVNATPGGVLGGITVVLYGMIGLVGAKIWVENGVDFGDPVNMVGLAAGLIAGIGGVTLEFGNDFQLGGIALGTILVIVFFHMVNGRRTAGPHYTTEALSHRDEPIEGHDRAIARSPTRSDVKPAPFAYRPTAGPRGSPRGARGEPGAKVLAGGQSLVPLLSMRLAAPSMLVDINALPDLDHVTRDATASGSVRWPGTPTCSPRPTYAGCSRWSPGAGARRPPHDPQPRDDRRVAGARRRGGRDADGAAPARRRRSTSRRPRGRRRSRPPSSSPVRWSPRWPTTRSPSEAFFPALPAGGGVAFEEIARRHGDYALVGVAALVRVDGDAVASARVGYLSVCDVPTVVDVTDALAWPSGGRPRRRAPPWPSWTPARTSTPPPPTAPTWCGCSPPACSPPRTTTLGVERSRDRMTEELHDVRLHVNGVAPRGAACRPGACSPTRCATTAA